MKAVESLILEHQLITRLADALEAYAGRTREGRPPDAAHLGLFAAAFTDFAECIHHEKEESILLPMLVRHGVRWDTGALPSVRRDHRQESYLIDVLRQAGERASSWHAEERRHIAAAAQALVDFQRHHHALETSELFPLLATHLRAPDLDELQQALEKFDRGHEPQRVAAIERIEALIACYELPRISGVHARGPELSDGAEPSECCLGLDE
ncbi:MAG: hemerythrin domain-containing protein [Deltaproteobacteria bacterium]